jgi:hypothetical protein
VLQPVPLYGLCSVDVSRESPLYTFLQILSVAIFEITPLNQLVTDSSAQFDLADAQISWSITRAEKQRILFGPLESRPMDERAGMPIQQPQRH